MSQIVKLPTMYSAPLTLIGFSFATICASVCPMNMAAVPMDHTMPMMAQAMHSTDERADVTCERCEQKGEELAIASASNVNAPSGIIHMFAVFHTIGTGSPVQLRKAGLPLANAGPPLRGDSLVGTVVLRV